MSRKQTNKASAEELDSYVHDLLLFIAHLLKEERTLSVGETTENVAKRGNLKNLKRIASGDSLEARVKVFLWQHPSVFTIENERVFLTKMSPDLEVELETSKEQRALDYVVFRLQQYGFMQVLISTLFGHLHHASTDIKNHFINNYTCFFKFLESFKHIFVILESYVALQAVYEKSVSEQKPLPKSDEYFIDERVMNNMCIITNIDEGKHLIDYICRTKKVVAIDCEGVNLGAKNGSITLVQLAFVDCDDFVPDITPYIKIYLFDVHINRGLLPVCLKRLFQAPFVMKVFQGCSADSTSLYMKHNISLNNVFDTVIAHRYLNNGGKADLYSLYEHYVGEQANRMKKDIKKQYINNPRLWAQRPLNELLTYYAAFDVFSLIRVYFAMLPKISEDGIKIITRKSNNASSYAARRELASDESPSEGSDSHATAMTQNHYKKKPMYVDWGPDNRQNNVYYNGSYNPNGFYPHGHSVPHQSSRNGYYKKPPAFDSYWNREQNYFPESRGRKEHRQNTNDSQRRSFKSKFQ
ncbi:uncharacterized protein B4U79_14406 [Dinothrombium tinctorium]|uniref:3'-5' exonuclease domain-containing protein n=1 Tax=Dinothrombium tinctorium TaxID=1965070 RepID=A0A3S3NYS1_9ACAR|nr:uncharacterized protein B4U79_14406 [Dinothrombium tinctorium]